MADQIQMFGEPAPATLTVPGPSRWKYARRAVPVWACERALSALCAFNQRAGASLSPFRYTGAPSDHLTRITGAVLDHPEVEDWEAVVDAAFRRPWWAGRASVGAVFGPAMVDHNIALASEPATEVALPGVRETSTGALLRALS